VELPGNITTEGKYRDVYLSRTSWKPVTAIKIDSTPDGPMLRSTQFGYTTIIGDNGFPQYYQLDHVLLTKPKHTTDHKHYDFELQIASFKQNTVWDFDYTDMVGTSFFFNAEEGDDATSPLLQQLLDAHNLHDDEVTETAGIDLQRAMGPQLKGDFYVYKTSNDHCSAAWYVFSQPIKMSLVQKQELESIFPALGAIAPSSNATDSEQPHSALQPAVCMKNSFDEGTLAKYDFYLDRDTGRNREPKGEFLILLPIIGTILLAIAVMSSVFVTDKASSGSSPLPSNPSGTLSPMVLGSPSYP
jgi:hypothetical protein